MLIVAFNYFQLHKVFDSKSAGALLILVDFISIEFEDCC